MTKDTTWTNTITAITLFAESLEETKAFYSRVFELPIFFEGDTSVVFKFGSTMNTGRAIPAWGNCAHSPWTFSRSTGSLSRTVRRTGPLSRRWWLWGIAWI